MSTSAHDDMVLHNVPTATISHDTAVFLVHEFGKIRSDYNKLHQTTPLLADWPGDETIALLTAMAVPLFIFAATVSRFVADPCRHPGMSLEKVLIYETSATTSKFDRTYLPVMDRLTDGLATGEVEEINSDFRTIVGSIIVTAEPLSTISLTQLLDLLQFAVDHHLGLLHSVLSVPLQSNEPVRLLHESFREFLTDPAKKQQGYWIDKTARHAALLFGCIKLMSGAGGLRENIYNCSFPGEYRQDIDQARVDKYISPALRYACLYWVHHLKESGQQIQADNVLHAFLKAHFLHWLEALGFLGRVADSIRLVTLLQSIVAVNGSEQVSPFLADARRFCLQNCAIMDRAPLQIYCAGLVFLPERSVIKQEYRQSHCSWLKTWPETHQNWSAVLQTLEGHKNMVTSVAFSGDGKQLASASWDHTVKVWDVMTGALQQTLEGHEACINSVAFSPNGKYLASVSNDRKVKIWDSTTGALQKTLADGSSCAFSVAFSADGKQLASSTEWRVRVWSLPDYLPLFAFESHRNSVVSVTFSPNSKQLASGSADQTVRLWDTVKGELLQVLEGHSGAVRSVAFSSDGKWLASASSDESIRIWDPATGKLSQVFNSHSDWVCAAVFSPDGKQLFSASSDGTLKVWDLAEGSLLQTIAYHSEVLTSIAISPEGNQLAAASSKYAVQLWDAMVDGPLLTSHSLNKPIRAISFSPDGKQLAWQADDAKISLWDSNTNLLLYTLEGHKEAVRWVGFSPDGKQLVSASWDRMVNLWNSATGELQRTFVGENTTFDQIMLSPDSKRLVIVSNHTAPEDLTPEDTVVEETATGIQTSEGTDTYTSIKVWDLATDSPPLTLKFKYLEFRGFTFSPDGQHLASLCFSTVRIWNLATGSEQVFEAQSENILLVAYATDGKLWAVAFSAETVKVWDPAEEETLQGLKDHNHVVYGVAFSPDGRQLASAWGGTIELWDVGTGARQQTIYQPSRAIDYMRYSKDGTTLITNAGEIAIGDFGGSTELSRPRSRRTLRFDGEWMIANGKRYLWVPLEYRSDELSFRHNRAAIGLRNGLVCMYEFALEEM